MYKRQQAAKEDLTFGDFVDLINPLQHIPGVSQVYRAMTGDTIKPAVKVAGGMLFGGPAGLLIGAGGAVIESMLGDPIAQVADAVLGTHSARTQVAAAPQAAEPPATQVADALPPTSPQALTNAGTQVAALVEPAQDAPRAAPSPVREPATAAPVAPHVAGPADIGSAGEATLAGLIAASQTQQATGAPRGGFDLAAYAGGDTRPPADGAAARSAAGKNIRAYFAEAVHTPAVVRRPPVDAKAPEASATEASATEARTTSAPKRTSDTPASQPPSEVSKRAAAGDDPGRAPAPAKPNGPPATAGAPAVPPVANQGAVPPWFADRVLQNLERYGAATKTETRSKPASG